ncbi:MAG: mitofilin family membrane protein [Alphaproteobacteria bacterium]|nr:mitofilin family membrane protein [Alphaproteobacteria bacterium]
MAKNNAGALKQAGKIIERFGGIRPMAAKIDVPVTTVQGWKKRDVIPAQRRALIIEAAEQNNIDLAGLMDGSPLPEKPIQKNPQRTEAKKDNVQSVKAAPTQPAYDQQKQQDVPESREPVQKPVSHPESPPPESPQTHDAILAAMEETRQKTVVQSVWIATGLILLAAIVAAFLLWPSTKEVEQQTEKLVELKEEVDEVREETSFLKKIIPADIQTKVDDLQNQARTLQNNVQDLTTRADVIAGDILGPDGGPLSERLVKLEEQMGSLSNNANFGGLLSRIESLESSVDGQAQLQASMDELRQMMSGGLGGSSDHGEDLSDETLTQNLAEAQANEEGALGETLEGVNGTDLKAAAMLIAFSQLRKSLYRQESFEDDLAVLQKLAGEDNIELQDAISRLAPHANGGVLSSAGLSQEFKGLAGDIVFSSIKGEDVSFKDKFKARLNNVLQVEKDGELITGTPTQATVNQAQQMLDTGNIQGAITQLQTLEGPAAQTAAPFIEQAQVSLLAKQVEQMLGSSILSKITGQLPIQDMLNGALGGNMGGTMSGNMGAPTNLPQIPGGGHGLNQMNSQIGGQINGQINMNDVKETLEGTLQPAEVISDEESGIRILPNQSGFKGFSAGSNNAAPLAP